MTTELAPDQVAVYLEASCALIEAELKALGDDAGWHPAAGEWCAREVVGHIIEAEKRGFGWGYWDYCRNFAAYSVQVFSGRWIPEVRAALLE